MSLVDQPVPAAGRRDRATGGRFSPARALALAEAHPAIVLAAMMLLVALAEIRFTTAMTSFQPDEIGYTRMSITIGDTLRPLALDEIGRDRLNQLYSLLIAPFYLFWGNPTAYRISHVFNALLMASSAIPAYLLARQLLERRAVALLAALLVIVAPWTTLASVQLTEVAAYPAVVWAYLAMTRSMTDPSPRRDLLALLAIGLTAFARLQLIVLLPLFVIAVLVHELGFALAARADEPLLRALRRRLLGEHRLLAIVAVLGGLAGLALLVSGRLASSLGFYGNTIEGSNVIPSATYDMARSNFVGIAVGVGVLPMVLAIGGWIEAVVWPRLRGVHALSVLSILVLGFLFLQVGAINARFTGFAVQERYVMYVAPLVLIGSLVALQRAGRLWFALLAGTAVVAPLLATGDLAPERTAFWYLISPGLTTFGDVFGPRLGQLAGVFDQRDASRYLIAAVLAALAALALALAARRARRDTLVAVVGGLTLVFCAAVTFHAFDKLVYGRDGESGLGRGSLTAVDWVDKASAGAKVSLLANQIGTVDTARLHWWSVEFWNRDVKSAYAFGGPAFVYNPPRSLQVDPRSGRIATQGTPGSYLVASVDGVPAAPLGTRVATSPDKALELVRPSGPLRAKWSVLGITDGGWMRLRQSAELRVFGPECGQLVRFALPAGIDGGRRVVLSGAGWKRTLRIEPGATTGTRLPACTDPGASVHVFHLSARPGLRGDAALITPRLVSISSAPRS